MQGNGIANASSSSSKLAMGRPCNLLDSTSVSYLLTVMEGPSLAYTQPHRLEPRLLFSSCALWYSFDLYQGNRAQETSDSERKSGRKSSESGAA